MVIFSFGSEEEWWGDVVAGPDLKRKIVNICIKLERNGEQRKLVRLAVLWDGTERFPVAGRSVE